MQLTNDCLIQRQAVGLARRGRKAASVTQVSARRLVWVWVESTDLLHDKTGGGGASRETGLLYTPRTR